MTSAIEFLERIGKPIKKTDEVKVGDIVGAEGNELHSVRLYYVNSIRKPSPPHLGPLKPYLLFKTPHYGFSIKDGNVCRQYIHTPMPGEFYKCIWYELDDKEVADFVKEIEDGKKRKDNLYYDEDIKNWWFPLYLIEDEGFKKLGNLIKDVEVPSWGIMAESTCGEAPIHKFVAAIKDDLKKAKEAYENIQAVMQRSR